LVGEEASKAGSSVPQQDEADAGAGDAPTGEETRGIKGPAVEERRVEGTDPKLLGWGIEAGAGDGRLMGGGEASPPRSPEPMAISESVYAVLSWSSSL
jgi:hypothetical protein